MSKQVISVEQLIQLAYAAGLDKGLAVHDELKIKVKDHFGLDLIADYIGDGVSEFNKMISNNFVVDY